MRKLFLVVLIVGMLPVAACGKKNGSDEPLITKDVTNSPKEIELQQEKKGVPVEEEVAEDKGSGSVVVNGVDDVLKNVAEVLQAIHGMKITGEIKSTTEMVGVVGNETTQVSGVVSLSPFTQHATMHTVSDLDPPSETEIYMTEEMIYVPNPEDDGWIAMSFDNMLGETGIFLSEPQFTHFSKYYEAFEFSENDAHYIITFTGSDDVYKEVVFENPDGNENYQQMKDSITAVSGTHELTIDKESFHIVGAKIEIEQTMTTMGIEVHSIEQISYMYSDFNKIDRVTVPAEVLKSAQVIEMSF